MFSSAARGTTRIASAGHSRPRPLAGRIRIAPCASGRDTPTRHRDVTSRSRALDARTTRRRAAAPRGGRPVSSRRDPQRPGCVAHRARCDGAALACPTVAGCRARSAAHRRSLATRAARARRSDNDARVPLVASRLRACACSIRAPARRTIPRRRTMPAARAAQPTTVAHPGTRRGIALDGRRATHRARRGRASTGFDRRAPTVILGEIPIPWQLFQGLEH